MAALTATVDWVDGRAPEQAPDRPGDRLGPYRLGRLIGAGGMGLVYEAEDEERASIVALKMLTRLGPGRLRRFKLEFRSVAEVTHHNLLRMYELIADGGRWGLTMELVHGVEFSRHTEDRHEGRLRAALRQLVDGILALHGHDLLHLDLKPANVLVEPAGRVVVLDFGLVQTLRDDGRRRPLAGTPSHMAPEQVRCEVATPACDWYAVGVMLFEALTGRLPFTGSTVEAVMQARLDAPAPDPRRFAPAAPPALAELCVRLLAPEPTRRADGRAALALLGPVPGGELTSAPAPRGSRLLGREGPLQALLAAFAARDQGTVGVQLRGPSGIGKSALLHHFAEQLRREAGALVLVGRCYERETAPYKGLDAIVDGLAEALLSGAIVAPPALLAGLDEALHMFPALAALPVGTRPELGAPRSLEDASTARRRAILQLRALLQWLASERPVVFVLDDVHWGNRDGAGLLVDLLAVPAPPLALVVLSARLEEAAPSPFLALLRERPPGWSRELELELEPLDAAAATALAAAGLGPERGEDARAIAEEAAGNPFFIEELSRGTTTGERSLHALVEGRIQALPDAARRVLHVLAVAAEPLTQTLAWRAAATTGDPHEAFAGLRGSALIRARGPRGTDAVETYHDRIREAVVATLTHSSRTSIHRALAETFDRQAPDEPERLARHWHGAGELGVAARHAERAAAAAERAFAFDRAAACLADAEAWDGSDAERVHAWQVRRAHALANAGRGGDAARVYVTAAAAREGPPGHGLLRCAVDSYLTAGFIDEGLALARPLLRALGVTPPAGPRRTTLELLGLFLRLMWRGPQAPLRPGDQDIAAVMRVDLCWSIGRGLSNIIPQLGTVYMLRSVLLAQDLGDPARTARGFAYFGGILPALGARAARRGSAYLERADELGAADPRIRGSVAIWHAFRALLAGEWAAAVAAVNRGLGHLAGVRTDTSWERTVGECFALVALDLQGAWPELRRRAEAGLADARARGDRYAQTVFSQFLAQCRLAAGDLSEALRLVAAGSSEWTRHEYTIQHFYALRLEVMHALYGGANAEADGLLSAAWPAIRRSALLTAPLSRIEIWLLEARVALALAGAAPGALKRAARATKEIRRTARPDAAAQARLIAACAGACMGRAPAPEFTACAAELDARDMGLLAACARRRAAALRGDPEGVAAADAWLIARGVDSPARLVAVYTPCPVP
jgi:hypothetical protein